MKLQELRPSRHTITIGKQVMRLRLDLNALDYLERMCGGLEHISDRDARMQKHLIRAFLLCNYPENEEIINRDALDQVKPSLYEVGSWFDPDTMNAVATELYKLALEEIEPPEDENSLGENQAEIAAAAIGALLKLCGRESLEKALKAFGLPRQEKS